MLPDAMAEHWPKLVPAVEASRSDRFDELKERMRSRVVRGYDRRTRANFSLEWENYEVGDRTWGMDLQTRVRDYFIDVIRIPVTDLDGSVMLDAGCGNGSQSVAYTEFGLEVVALDLSSGLEHGYAFRHRYEKARPDRVHFLQGDLLSPPLGSGRFDLIHSMGVLHHTPSTEESFRTLCPLLRPGGTLCVWLYSYEPWVTPLVNSIRAVTTRIPAGAFARLAHTLAVAFQLFTMCVNALGVRSYARLSRREAALALMDIFGAPYAHYHSFAEVAGWYGDEGFDEVWECAKSRRGFGACGRLSTSTGNRPRH